MFVTYLVVKLALQALVDEANRLAAEAETQERAAYLKSRVAQLEMDLATGAIDQNTYTAKASEILSELQPSLEQGQSLGGQTDA
jgi:hypothetical protein